MKQRMKQKLNNAGYTLVEVVIAVAIFSILSIAITGFIATVNNNFRKSQIEVELQYEAQVVNNQLRDIIVIVSGAGNKVFKLMNNIAIGEDSKVELHEDDLVIIASPIVPGTEKVAAHMEDDIYKAGVKVVKLSSKEVLSMHASKEDLKTMLYFIKPNYYLPI